MRRKTRLGLVIGLPLLVLFGLYTGFWFLVADRLRQGLADQAQLLRAKGLDVTWAKATVNGFPFVFRASLEDARVVDDAAKPSPEVTAEHLYATTAPWDFRHWRLSAPRGLKASFVEAGQRLPMTLAASEATGEVGIDGGGSTFLVNLTGVTAAAAATTVTAQSAEAKIVLPPHPPTGHTEPSATATIALRQVKLPAAVPPLGDTVDDVTVAATLMGPLPSGPPRQAAAAWRDAGGTLELDSLHLEWGQLGVTANGTVALDGDLQPTGAFSGAIQGYDQVMTALAASGRLRAGDIGLARIGLAMLAKAGPNGRPEIRTSFTIEGGEMRLGPVKLGPAPRISWE
ncbi:MAG TPA: DUF2125 domain-containing protein [Stellaceae bacterium]|nr:DUF2125 domain-containing protein [Stellaceae bacterium]